MNTRKSAAALVGIGLAFGTACSGNHPKQAAPGETFPSASPSASPSADPATKALAADPVRVEALAHQAEQQFETSIKKGPTKIWIFAGFCAVMGERPTGSPSKLETVNIVPNPGVLHIRDPKTGAIVTEAIAWDMPEGRYVTGLLSVLSPDYSVSYNVTGAHDQFNLSVGKPQLDTGIVRFSEEHQEVIGGQDISLMDAEDSGTAKSAKAFSRAGLVRNICSAAVENPPSFVPLPIV